MVDERESATGDLVERVRRALAGAVDSGEAIRLTVEAVHRSSDRYDWTGIYLMEGKETLVLSHFIGAPSPHTRIPVGKGICGAAVREKSTVVVPDVASDDRYLACSVETRSEIVVPILDGSAVIGEIDIDSHRPDAFGAEDRVVLETIAALLAGDLARRRISS